MWVISIPAGLLIGFLTSKIFPFPANQFDDKHTFHGVTYADDVAEFDNVQQVEKSVEMKAN